MELKSGYKQTEVGVIPVDWDVAEYVSFGQVIDGDRGVQYPSVDDLRDSGHCLFLNAGNVTKQGFRFTECQFISVDKDKKLNKGKLTRGDVVLTTRGTVGNFAYFTYEVPYEYIRINSGMVILRNTSPMVVNSYQYLVLGSRIVKSQLERLSYGSAQPQLTVKGISTLKIPFPPTKAEQEAIAEALNDVDALIESLEQLITKKRKIKQGAMQELLTGKRRLPGFSKNFSKVSLRDLLHYERPDPYIVRNTEYSERGDIPVITANKSFILGYTIENFGICRDLPAIVFDDFTTDIKYVDFPFKVKSSAIKLLRPKHDQVNLRYIFNRMHLIHLPLGDHKRYYISEYQNLEVLIPDIEEQEAIATILSNMNEEIVILKDKLAKARQVKQGMMQELLTGKIRLV
ncbi:MAG: restriction endonuclease subunit S [Desulfobacterales bacterium]